MNGISIHTTFSIEDEDTHVHVAEYVFIILRHSDSVIGSDILAYLPKVRLRSNFVFYLSKWKKVRTVIVQGVDGTLPSTVAV